MFKSRQFLFSTLIFALVPPFVLRGASTPVAYAGGSVKAIPANSTGAFNFDDAKELRFNYGDSVYALPYAQITSTEAAKKGEKHHLLRKIPVPSFSRDPKATLTISYKDASGASGTLNFDLTATQADEARETIAIKKAVIVSDEASRSNDFWGDRYWKTNRNKDAWDVQTAKSSPASPSATPATK